MNSFRLSSGFYSNFIAKYNPTNSTREYSPSFTGGKFKIFPNPVKDMLHIEYSQTALLRHIQIHNSIGQLILEEHNSASINTNNLQKGIYFIALTNEYGLKISQAFIKE